MIPKRNLDEVISDVRVEYRLCDPPPFLETRLRAAARSVQKARKARRWVRIFATVSVSLAVAAGLMLWETNRVANIQRRPGNPGVTSKLSNGISSTGSKAAPRIPSLRDRPSQPVRLPLVASKSARKTPGGAGARRPADVEAGEFVTGFIELPGSDTLRSPLEGSILRVQMPKEELRRYGFDVPPQRAADLIRADFLVGEDGLARAVRLVQ